MVDGFASVGVCVSLSTMGSQSFATTKTHDNSPLLTFCMPHDIKGYKSQFDVYVEHILQVNTGILQNILSHMKSFLRYKYFQGF